MNIYDLSDEEAIPLIAWASPSNREAPSRQLYHTEALASEAGLKIMGRLAKAGLLKPGDDPMVLIDWMIGVYNDN
jgi:hypothetical protein